MPVRYVPSEARFAHEGRKLVIEAAIASRAKSFVNSPRSAVSDLIETLKRVRAAEKRAQPLKSEL